MKTKELRYAERSRQILESFFGGPMVLPEPGTSPEEIYTSYVKLRARVIDSEECRSKLQLDSPGMLTRFICCRAQVGSVLREPDRAQWWLTGMDLHDAFLAGQEPITRFDRICTWDLKNLRGKKD
ncbi:hypothetical protein GGR58DRAFT_516997 [Xylaria digitata]|nr:hypothetical protein GGR58DRAFT_516997 [Xylaria digitata]